jgi:hypothetical protein
LQDYDPILESTSKDKQPCNFFRMPPFCLELSRARKKYRSTGE